MPHDSNKSASSSGPTSTSAPRTSLSESKYLAKQAADARGAISAVMNDIKHDLAQGADPRGWMQVAPWTTLAGAAVAGFVAAAVAVPSKEDQALKRLRRIEEALNPRPRPAEDVSNGDHATRVERGESSFLSGLAGQLIRSLQPVLMSALTAGITAKTVDKDQPTGGTNPGEVAYPTAGSTPPGQSPDI